MFPSINFTFPKPYMHEAVFNNVYFEALNTCSKTVALSTAIHHFGDQLNAIPSTALGLHLHDQQVWLYLQYWLRLKMVEEGAK